MKLAKDDLVAALRLRYDHYSAQTIFDAARARAGLADQPAYEGGELAALRAALAKVGDRLGAVEERIAHLLGEESAPAPRPESAPANADARAESKPDGRAAKPDADTKADSKSGAKADSQTDAKSDSKPDVKADARVDAKSDPKSDSRAEAKADGTKTDAKAGGKPEATAEATVTADVKPEAKIEAIDGKFDTSADISGAISVVKPGKDDEPVETKIVLTGVKLREGEQLMVCGDRPELGNWEPTRACPMRRDGEAWLATIKVPRGARGVFKFFRRTADGQIVWETGENRELVPAPRIDAVWQ